jgi:hypothetical protein
LEIKRKDRNTKDRDRKERKAMLSYGEKTERLSNRGGGRQIYNVKAFRQVFLLRFHVRNKKNSFTVF